jgi:hypothetical protein
LHIKNLEKEDKPEEYDFASKFKIDEEISGLVMKPDWQGFYAY